MTTNRFALFFIISLFFVTGCSYKVAVDFDRPTFKKLHNQHLERAILRFYSYLATKDIEKMYEMESPSFRYLTPFQKYRSYYKGFKKPKKLSIVDIEKKDKVYVVKLRLLFSDGTKVILSDYWLNMNNKFYHNSYDPFFFPY